jgi:hypothetical protein
MAKGQKHEGRAGKVFRVSQADNAAVKTREMAGRLQDGDAVLCLENVSGKGYHYSLIDCTGPVLRLYPKGFRFYAGTIGMAAKWQPTEDEVHELWAMLGLRGEGDAPHPLIAEMSRGATGVSWARASLPTVPAEG